MSAIIKIEVGGQLRMGQLARLVVLFVRAGEPDVLTCWDLPMCAKLVSAMVDYASFVIPRVATLDADSDAIHKAFEARPHILTQAMIESAGNPFLVTHLHGRATLARLALDLVHGGQNVTLELPAAMTQVLYAYVHAVLSEFDEGGALLVAAGGLTSH